MTEPIVGYYDFATVTLWLFWIFFALLVYYLQTENMREGYPLESDAGGPAPNQGPFPLPKQKTFKLMHGRGEVTVPDGKPENRDVALEQSSPAAGSPLEPTGDPMADGVGPASWTARKDWPEVDGHGHAKIRPMAALDGFEVSAGNDPRELPVVSGDGHVVGEICEMWVDAPEQLVRYIEIALDDDHGGGKRIVPIQLTRIHHDRVIIKALYAAQFAGIPKTAKPDEVTLLEEDKITGYVAGGWLYASEARQDALI